MIHRAHSEFWACYHRLPAEVKSVADKQFALLKDNPRHPSLRLKKVGRVWSARVNQDYRALATERPYGFLWVWIGTHADYDRLLRSR